MSDRPPTTGPLLHPFIHLRVCTTYSLSKGAIKVPELVALCREHRMPAVGIAEYGNLFSALEASLALSREGIQPLMGCVIMLDPSGACDGAITTRGHVVLFAKNSQGYRHLLQLASRLYEDAEQKGGHYITWQDLQAYNEGLICLSGGVGGTLSQLLENDKKDDAMAWTAALAACFPDRFYLEIQRHDLPAEKKTEPSLLLFAEHMNIPLVATNSVFFSTPDMVAAHDVLLCIGEGSYVHAESRSHSSPAYYFRSLAEMVALFHDLPEALANSVLIAKRCAVMAEPSPPRLPSFESPNGESEEEAIAQLSLAGLATRLERHVYTERMTEAEKKQRAAEYTERLHYELNVINAMHYAGYFLIVSDFVRWSRQQGIPVGPGRGSGAGSIVAWCLEITDLDPIRFGLIFERFLNPERVSMPDFDIDFCQYRRDEVIHYVQSKYGHDRVAQIITFGTLQARAVIRDVGRVLQAPYPKVDRISKLVPHHPSNPITLPEALELEPLLKKEYRSDPQVKEIIDIALRLEGLHRHASTHAAGLVIADKPLVETVATYRDPRSTMLIIQYSMKYAEEAGLVKFDFLGLKTLTVIANCCALVSPEGDLLDISRIPLNDEITYRLLCEGNTLGVFQFESRGMRDAIRRLKPDSIEDLIALGALYRPGPMDNIPTYIARKHGHEKPDYLHPKLQGLLSETFGVIIYQEQVVKIAQILAGYSLGSADLLRRAMGKKIKSEMDAQREIFATGAAANGVDTEQAATIFDLVAKFAGYGFNKAHATGYAMISYQTAYLKAHYPEAFMVASMNVEMMDTDKLAIFIDECKQVGIPILPPDLNRSQPLFSIEINEGKKTIRYGLGAIKNVGIPAMESLCREREAQGPFTSLPQMIARCGSDIINKRQLEFLIKAGAADSLHRNRQYLLDHSEAMIRAGQASLQAKNSNQLSMFDDIAQPPRISMEEGDHLADLPYHERLHGECQAYGFYLHEHPLTPYQPFLLLQRVQPYHQLFERLPSGTSTLTVAGVLMDYRIRNSAKGRFVTLILSDISGRFEVSLFDDAMIDHFIEAHPPLSLLVIHAEMRKDQGGARLIAKSIHALGEYLAARQPHMTLHVTNPALLPRLKALCEPKEKGRISLSLELITEEGDHVTIRLPDSHTLSPLALPEISQWPGMLKVAL